VIGTHQPSSFFIWRSNFTRCGTQTNYFLTVDRTRLKYLDLDVRRVFNSCNKGPLGTPSTLIDPDSWPILERHCPHLRYRSMCEVSEVRLLQDGCPSTPCPPGNHTSGFYSLCTPCSPGTYSSSLTLNGGVLIVLLRCTKQTRIKQLVK